MRYGQMMKVVDAEKAARMNRIARRMKGLCEKYMDPPLTPTPAYTFERVSDTVLRRRVIKS